MTDSLKAKSPIPNETSISQSYPQASGGEMCRQPTSQATRCNLSCISIG